MDNVDDVLENIMSSFETHSAGVARIYDMPAIAESTWHGACLACAEMARRSLVSPDKLPKLIEWLSQVGVLLKQIAAFNESCKLGLIFRLAERSAFNWIQCSRCGSLCSMGFGANTRSLSTG